MDSDGCLCDVQRTSDGRPTDVRWTSNGRQTSGPHVPNQGIHNLLNGKRRLCQIIGQSRRELTSHRVVVESNILWTWRRSGGVRESFRENSSKKIDFAHRLGALDRPRSREPRAVKIPASYDAWRPPNNQKNDSEKVRYF